MGWPLKRGDPIFFFESFSMKGSWGREICFLESERERE